jgi:hypothetical protein
MVSTNNRCILFLNKIQTIKKPAKFGADGKLICFNPAISTHEKQVPFEHRKRLPIC